jgi:hypothetical protein
MKNRLHGWFKRDLPILIPPHHLLTYIKMPHLRNVRRYDNHQALTQVDRFPKPQPLPHLFTPFPKQQSRPPNHTNQPHGRHSLLTHLSNYIPHYKLSGIRQLAQASKLYTDLPQVCQQQVPIAG